MKKIIIVSIIFLLFISLFFSCELGLNESKTYNAIDATNALSKLAPVFSEVLKDNPEFIGLIKDEANKKFDGETDVLFDNIKNLSVIKGGKTLKDLLEAKLITKGQSESLDQLIAKIPYFNIYVFTPEEKSPNKNVDENIIFCANRYDVDDMKLDYIEGYDLNGNKILLNAQIPPKDCIVFVLGINERVEYNSKNYLTTKSSLDDGSINHNEKLKGLYLKTTMDPWPFGNAEVYILYLFGGNNGIRQNYSEVDKSGKWYIFDNVIYSYSNLPENMYYKIRIMEEDWWPFTIDSTLSLNYRWEGIVFNFTFTFKIQALDDLFGETQVYYWHDNPQEYFVGNAYIKLGY
ncbi:MAG TPA: hypothetical protein PLF21_04755 [Exilispira sp.]|nr:hypothetical protein [Exilispira sp.]